MGTVELAGTRCIIRSHIITYGNAADPLITEQIRAEIEDMWNAPTAVFNKSGNALRVLFEITASCQPDISDIAIYSNTDPLNNYFRIENFAHGNISFVDGLGCNSGYFKLENLYPGSTTAAHEYGHTLGLAHPENTDIRGKGVPGIMYPRGTLVDPEFQYDPAVPAGTKGGTLHPQFRRVLPQDIDDLRLQRLRYQNNVAIIGDFSNIWHPDHGVGDSV